MQSWQNTSGLTVSLFLSSFSLVSMLNNSVRKERIKRKYILRKCSLRYVPNKHLQILSTFRFTGAAGIEIFENTSFVGSESKVLQNSPFA